VDASIRQSVLKQLNALEKEIVSKLTNEDNLAQTRLKSLFAEVKQLISETYQSINESMTSDLTELVSIESSKMIKTLESVALTTTAVLPIEKVISLVKNSLIAGAPSEEWWSRQDTKLRQAFEDQVRTGVLLGETNNDIIKRIRGTRAFNYTNGIMNVARNEAEALVRSSVQTASNQARFEALEENNDLITSYRHVATLDSRTSDVCIVRDGKRWDAKTKKPIGHNLAFQVPPIHWNCRSTLIPEIEGVNLDLGTRASVDGPVSGKTTFEDFLKKQDKAFVEETLGKGKAELFLQGKITLRQLLDQSGNPLTLKQLKELI
jgi:SPP1 gp7 family putative phage head morphogenesis protein